VDKQKEEEGRKEQWLRWHGFHGNQSIFQLWVPKHINFGKKVLKFTPILVQKQAKNRGLDLEIAFGNPLILIPNEATEGGGKKQNCKVRILFFKSCAIYHLFYPKLFRIILFSNFF